jgi:hypothetical protein
LTNSKKNGNPAEDEEGGRGENTWAWLSSPEDSILMIFSGDLGIGNMLIKRLEYLLFPSKSLNGEF